jgi:hypothetical protein
MTTTTLIADLKRLEEEAAIYRRPDVEQTLTRVQLEALREVEGRIVALRKAIAS